MLFDANNLNAIITDRKSWHKEFQNLDKYTKPKCGNHFKTWILLKDRGSGSIWNNIWSHLVMLVNVAGGFVMLVYVSYVAKVAGGCLMLANLARQWH